MARPRSVGGSTGNTSHGGAVESQPVAGHAVSPQDFVERECDPRIPAAEVVHEVALSEFKRLRLTIADIQYPVQLVADQTTTVDLFASPHMRSVLGAGVNGSTAAKRMQPLSKVAAYSGVPVDRALDDDLRDLLEPAVVDVSVPDSDELLAGRKKIVSLQTRDGAIRARLGVESRRDLAEGLPVVVDATSNGKHLTARLLPSQPSAEPTEEHVVTDLAGFLAAPMVATEDGGSLPVSLSADNIRDLRERGVTGLRVKKQPVLIRTAAATEMTANPLSAAVWDSLLSKMVPAPAVDERTLELALYLPWKQEWHLDGYTRGQLLHSLALAPQEETVIEVSSWDRRKRATDVMVGAEIQQTMDFTDTTKDAVNVLDELKSDSNYKVDTMFQAGVTISDMATIDSQASAGGGGGVANSSRSTLDYLKESVTKIGAKITMSRQTKIGESLEVGAEQKVTRRVRNPNMCHALTLNYFEVLAHYEIRTALQLAGARLCVLVKHPYAQLTFTKNNIRVYEGALRQVLLQPELLDGFDAARKIFAVEHLSQAVALLDAAKPPRPPTTDQSSAEQKALAEALARLNDVVTAVKDLQAAVIIMEQDPDLPGALREKSSETDRRRHLYRARLKEIAPTLWQRLGEISKPGQSLGEQELSGLLRALREVNSIEEISPDRMNRIGPESDAVFRIAKQLYFADDTWHPGWDFIAVQDAGLVPALKNFMDAAAKYTQAKLIGGVVEQAKDSDTGEEKTAYSPKEVAEALEREDALLAHLNEYAIYYRSALLRLLPPNDRLWSTLTQFSSLIERRVLGEVDGMVAVPIRADADPNTARFFKELVTKNADLTKMTDGFDVTLPTSGVNLETSLSSCTACEEYVEEVRALDLSTRRAELGIKRAKEQQERREAERYHARLEADDLHDPENRTGTIHVTLDNPPAAPPASPGSPT